MLCATVNLPAAKRRAIRPPVRSAGRPDEVAESRRNAATLVDHPRYYTWETSGQERGERNMQPEWLLAVPIFGLGFVAGYFVRAMISRRRRHRSRRQARAALGEGAQFAPRL